MVVDDTEDIRDLISLVLEEEGYEVRVAARGDEALRLVRERRPDLITLDLSLPGLDGRDLLRELHDDHALAAVPLVVVSAFADSLTAAERHLADEIIVKPFDLDDLLRRIERAACTRPLRSGPRGGPRDGR